MVGTLPRWIDIGLLPALNILAAFIVSGIIIALIGENPFTAIGVMIKGAFVNKGALGYTLFYTTNFIFTGLAVAVAFHALLFNIGGEGQAIIGGLGIGILILALDGFVPPFLLVLLAIPVSALFGAAWGVIPGWLQAKRGSHIVITTIMFNFIAASVMVWLLAGLLIEEAQKGPQTRAFADGISLMKIHELAALLGIVIDNSPLNLSFVIAILASIAVWILIWRTRLGYVIRATGHSERAVVYAGHSPERVIIITMAISGALAGMMGLNEILGVQQKVIINFTAGYGFTGIAVALMGRNHPFGIFFAALLFGALFQGGTEIDFEFQTITREVVLMIQGLIILFSGALVYMFNPMVERLYFRIMASRQAPSGGGA
jgi:simple sugar transport system permease protein